MIKEIEHKYLTDFYKQFDFEIADTWIKDINPILSLVDEEDGNIVSACTVSNRFGSFILDYIGVVKSKQGEGIGKKMFNAMVDKMKALNCKKIYLTAKEPKFFERMGARYTQDKIELLGECQSCELYYKTCFPRLMVYEVKNDNQ